MERLPRALVETPPAVGESASFHFRPSQNQLPSADQPGGDAVNASYQTT